MARSESPLDEGLKILADIIAERHLFVTTRKEGPVPSSDNKAVLNMKTHEKNNQRKG